MLPIVAALANAGLTLLAEAIRTKGKEVVEKKLDVKLPNDLKELTPEKIEELHRIEIEHETDLLTLITSAMESINRYKEAEVLDRISAREQELGILQSQAPLLLKIFKPLLALLIVTSTFILIYVLFFVDIPSNKRDIINFIFGNVFGALMAVITYYFGSSESSSYKNEIIRNVIGKRDGIKEL